MLSEGWFMKLKDALNIDDLRRLAKARIPRMVFDYIDGGADDEVTLGRSVSRFDDYELTWRALRDVSSIDTSTTIMGQETRLPFFISPTATTRLFHPAEGELAMARAAETAGVIYACSTLASQTVEDIADDRPGGRGDDADDIRQERDGLLAGGVEKAFRFKPLFPFFQQFQKRAFAGMLHRLDDDLVFAAAGIGGQFAGDNDLQPVFRLNRKTLGRAAPADAVDHGLIGAFDKAAKRLAIGKGADPD